jgi:2-dehydro-3-deoxyphosphogluconate aldolase/(4S)-4-hydroxy-2-oxoglutarate aldolase
MSHTRSHPDIAALLGRARIVPVLTIRRLADAVPLARALAEGGLDVIEIALRSPVAAEAAAAIMRDVPAVAIGIGTVQAAADLALAERLGARFAVSPGATREVLSAAAAGKLPFLPGVATPSEIMAAAAHGFSLLKFFPAESAGGIAALKSFAGPFPDLRFCPTGGIDEARASAYLALGNVVAIGGSWMAPEAYIAAGKFDRIAAAARRARAIADEVAAPLL